MAIEIVDFSIEHDDFHSHVSLPEGNGTERAWDWEKLLALMELNRIFMGF